VFVPTAPQDGGAHGSTPSIKLGGLVDHLETIRCGRRVMLVACGTSYHACLAARCVPSNRRV
jgi:glucosamine--fructose-6-phosphate aminotransferase (isomerizing)